MHVNGYFFGCPFTRTRKYGTVIFMSLTSLELAEICGVSRGTVDRALKNRPGVSEKSRKLVLETAYRHGYRPNFIGKALSSGKTSTIGIVLFDFKHSFFAELYSAFEEEAGHCDHVMFPMLSHHDPELEMESVRRLVERNVDGIMILPVNRGPEFEEFLSSLSIPVVTFGNRLSESFRFSGIDDFCAAADAFSHLRNAGCRVIHYFSPPLNLLGKQNLYAQERRHQGYLAACREHGNEGRCFTEREELIAALKPGDAVLSSSDFYALGLQLFLRDRRPELFQQVRLMGFDGLDVLRFAPAAIGTVRFSHRKWAQAAFSQIFALQAGDAARDILIPHEICEIEPSEFQ